MTLFHYRAYGVNLASEIELPELLPAPSEQSDLQIVLRTDLPQALDQPDDVGVFYQSSRAYTLLNIARVGRYLVDQETIAVEPEADPETVRLFLLESALPALLQRRGLLVIRASAIATARGAVLFSSLAPCSGRSTLAAGLCFRGQRLLADTVCVMSDSGEITPAYPQLHLWKRSFDFLDLPLDGYPTTRPDLMKFAVPVAFEQQPQPLRAIIDIAAPRMREVKLAPLDGIRRVSVLKNCLYFPQLVSHEKSQMMARMVQYAHHASIYALDYRRGKEGVVETLGLIEEWLQA